MTVPGSGIRLHTDDFADLEPEFPGGSRAAGLILGITSTPPEDRGPAQREQWRCVLSHDRDRRQSAGGNEVETSKTVGPGLGSRVDRARVGDGALRDRAADELALPAGALDEVKFSPSQGDGERKTREAGTRPEVDDAAGAADGFELECDQGIGHVILHDPARVTDRRRGNGVAGQELHQPAQLLNRRRWERVAPTESL